MSEATTLGPYAELRRDLHRHPEPAWREFYTTARIVSALSDRPVDELYVGPEALDPGERGGVPDDAELAAWRDRAREAGADPDVLDRLAGGNTGCVAVLRRGEGPTVGLRVDIDALPIAESADPGHAPAAEGFRSEHDGYMHACGHDAHTAIGMGVLDAVAESGFAGTLKLFFQPSEEQGTGGRAMAASGHLDDLDALLAVHIGLDHPSGEVVAGVDGFLAVRGFTAAFEGASAHAGGHPEAGNNAIQALATATSELYAIPRHADGPTRVNAGVIEGGTASNVIPETARIEGEVRGGTTDLADHMKERADRVVESAADLHDCAVETTWSGPVPSAESDDALRSVVAAVAREHGSVDSLLDRDDLGGSEDATFLMRRVQERGGVAAYVGIGTDHPGGHHTGTFDVDEADIRLGIDVLAGAIRRVGERPPS